MRTLFAVVNLVVGASAQAGITWHQNPANGHWYALTSPLGWAQAEAHAAAMGGHLVTIRSAAEQAWLSQTFGSVPLWIGFSDAQHEGVWAWASGEAVTYTSWCAGEPNNASDEDFANLSGCIGWNDVQDAITVPGIVELALPAATYTAFGAGCPGPNALAPALAGMPGEPPRLGTTSRMRVSNLPLTVTVPVFVLGLSDTVDPGPPAYSLPLDLGVLGWPGCSQLVTDDVVSFAITTTGEADHALQVPLNAGLVGFVFYAQALVLYSGGGVATSNGLTCTVGF